MEIDIFPDADATARRAAALVAAECRAAVTARGKFVFAVSGGTTPWLMLRQLAHEDLPWEAVFIAQVDERVAPPGHPDRNLTHIQASLQGAPLRPERILAMPVNDADLEAAASHYARALEAILGTPAVLDLIHLGLGPDGHTASLVPDDPVLEVTDRDVALTNEYQGRRRMTLTYPLLNRARRVMWLVGGASKADMLVRLKAADSSIPAGRVRQDNALVYADRDAGSKLKQN
jgi:6-phosphogluconolactonase